MKFFSMSLVLATLLYLPSVEAAGDCESEANWSAVRACSMDRQMHALDLAFKDTLKFVRARSKQNAALLERAQATWLDFAGQSCDFTVASRLPDSNDLRHGCWQEFIAARIRVLKAYKRDYGRVPDNLMDP